MLLRLITLLLALAALLGTGDPAWAQGQGFRPVGHRLAQRPTRAERKRFSYRKDTTYFTDVAHDPARLARRIEGLGRLGGDRAKVTLVDDGKGSATHWRTGKGYSVYKVEVPAQRLAPAGGRGKGKQPLKVCVSAGVHGDEGVGPEAAVRFVERALKDKGFSRRFDLTVVIKVDPFGARRTPANRDPNRCFGPGRWLRHTQSMAKAAGAPSGYDLFVDLHSAGRNREGFFAIRGQDDGKLSGRILRAMKTQALWDAPAAKPKVGPYGFHTLGGVQTATPGTFKGYMGQGGARHSYTLEAPRTLAPERQVKGMLKLLRSTLDNVARHGR